MATTKPVYEQPAEYKSQYQGQMDAALDKVTNRETFTYDPLKDVSYQSLAKVYKQQGDKAAKDTLGDAASLNGGYGSSYAVTASQQVRNDYNQQLASQIPALKEAAYNQYMNEQNLNLSTLDALRAADDSAYGKYRDSVADSQWKYGQDYQAYRDNVSDKQWKTEYDRGVYESDRNYNYQKSRDAVADKQWKTEYDRGVYESNRDYNYQKSRDKVADSQWKTEYNYQKSRDKVSDSQWAKEYALSKKSAATSSRSSASSSNNGYIGSSTGNTGSNNYTKAKTTASKSTPTSKGHHSSKISKKTVSGRALRNAAAKAANKNKDRR